MTDENTLTIKPEPSEIYGLLAAVMRDVSAVRKDDHNDFQKAVVA